MTTTKSILYGTTTDNFVFPVTISNDTNLLITQSNVIPTNGSFMLGSANALAIQADSEPLAVVSPDGYKGWYYINQDNKGGVNLKFNWYFYDGTNHGYTVADIREITATVSLGTPANKPFFVLYTKTGSKRIYQTNELMIEGEKVLFYFAETGYIPQNNDNLRLVRLTASSDVGLVEPGMPVQYLTLHSNSSDPLGKFSMVCENLGFRINNITCNYALETPATGGGGTSSDVNILSSVPLDVNILSSDPLDVVNGSLSAMTFSTSSLGAKLLNVYTPEITNINLKTSDIILPVSIGSTVAISNDALTNMTFTGNNLNVNVSNPAITQAQITTLSWFDGGSGAPIVTLPLPIGAYTNSFNVSNANKVMVWGSGIKHNGSPKVFLQCANSDNIEFYDTVYHIDVSTADIYGTINENVPVKYCRLIIRGGEIDDIGLKVNYK
jgi:hypothetical protein